MLSIAFFALVAWLLVSHAREIEWAEVGQAMREHQLATLALAAALSAASHLLYSCFDLLGRHYTGHTLPTRSVMTTTFICYAFNLNLGSLVGGLALRYRLYSRLGLRKGVIARIVTISMLSNWLGYVFLAGLVFLLRPLPLPEDWPIGSHTLQAMGAILLSMSLGYLALCHLSTRRSWTMWGHELVIPSSRMAALQLLMSSVNWLLMASVVFVLMPAAVPFTSVASALFLAGIAAVITHVPAGLGVLEAVFVAVLAPIAPKTSVLAALLTYRALYYLVPLLGATATHVILEARKRSRRPIAR